MGTQISTSGTFINVCIVKFVKMCVIVLHCLDTDFTNLDMYNRHC